MGIGHDEIRLDSLNIHLGCAEALDGVNTEQDAVIAAKAAQPGQIEFQAGAILDRADRQHPRTGIAGGHEGGLGIVDMEIDFPECDAMAPLRFPGNAVGRKFFITADNIIAELPVESARHHGQCLGCVLDQGDIVDRRRVKQVAQLFTQVVLGRHPCPVTAGAAGTVFLGKGLNSGGRTPGPGGDGGVVEVGEIRLQRELGG